jgi:ribosome biogenesis GTPase
MHSGEPGCAVAAAVESGELAAERWASYRKLMKEANRHQSAAEQKRLAKQIGRAIKLVYKLKR